MKEQNNKMLNFLKQSRKLINTTESICIVIGNESCDLDSAVSAISLAYFYHEQQQKMDQHTKQYLPVLNIPRRDYPLKTEVQFLFQKYAITIEHLTFRDELQQDLITRSDFILVDHHVSAFAARCIEVFDHRPIDTNANLPTHCKQHLELVGSCATLIASLYLQGINMENVAESLLLPLALLRSAIVLDTVNFAAQAARATPKDHEMCEQLERILAPTTYNQTRAELFQQLVAARADVSSLTPLQLLHKDMKILTNTTGSIKIALPGFPLSVQHFVQKSDALIAVEEFVRDSNSAIVLLIGMLVDEQSGNVQRDIGLININQPELCAAILNQLLAVTEPALCLQPYNDCTFMNGHFYRQNNVKATRKHILPIVKQVLEQWTC